ncbi:Transcriptional regulator, IclR family [Olavius algarvensis Delta 1 endosymbiont]|nr:Transcriptional regulator, IclR family [Olavius algarvensis Delta 1 endosymbiont]
MASKSKTKDKAIQVGLETLSDAKPPKDRQFVTALARGLEVLRCFRAENPMLGNQEIAQKTGLPKPTVSRLTFTLTELGYLRYSKNLRKYQLGTAVLALGYSLLTNMDIIKFARPLLQELADYAQASVGLCAQDRLDMVYLENIHPNTSAFVLRFRAGDRIPMATTATGRAFLGALSEKDRTYLMDQIRLRDEANWPTLKAGIEQALKDYHDFGFCMSLGEYNRDVNAIGVPIKSPVNGSNIMVVNCGAAAFQMRRHMFEDDIGPRLILMAGQIEAQLLRT